MALFTRTGADRQWMQLISLDGSSPGESQGRNWSACVVPIHDLIVRKSSSVTNYEVSRGGTFAGSWSL